MYTAELANMETSSVVIGQEYIDKFCSLNKGCYMLITVAAMGLQNVNPENLEQLSYEI